MNKYLSHSGALRFPNIGGKFKNPVFSRVKPTYPRIILNWVYLQLWRNQSAISKSCHSTIPPTIKSYIGDMSPRAVWKSSHIYIYITLYSIYHIIHIHLYIYIYICMYATLYIYIYITLILYMSHDIYIYHITNASIYIYILLYQYHIIHLYVNNTHIYI